MKADSGKKKQVGLLTPPVGIIKVFDHLCVFDRKFDCNFEKK